MFSVRRNAESYIKDGNSYTHLLTHLLIHSYTFLGKFKEFTQGKHVKTMSIFYLPEVKQQILQLCDEKSVANKGIVLKFTQVPTQQFIHVYNFCR